MEETLITVKKILQKFAKNQNALASAGPETRLREDLAVSSANLVDVLLEMEDSFNVSISDNEIQQIETLGEAVRIIDAKKAAG